jgi:hypothetical protein
VVLVALSGSGCGNSEPPPPRAEPIPLGEPPAVVWEACARAPAAVPALCPRRWPLLDDSRPKLQELSRGSAYLLSFNDPAFRTADVGHVLVGGQQRELPLAGERGERWPGAPALGLPAGGKLVARAGGALAVKMPRYPRGGVHGGHVVALWNSGGHGYAVSLHFAGYPLPDRVATAFAMARSAG